MDENILKLFAQQLRKPEGDMGKQTGERMNVGNKLINEFTIEQLDVKPEDDILEIGMGNGFFVKDILSVDSSVRYAGCDFSETMIHEAKERNKDYVDSKQAHFFLTTVEKLPFEANTFNKAFTVNTIYFWENPSKVLSELRRVLEPSGILIISLRPKTEMMQYPFVKYDFNLYSEDDVVDLLLSNSFSVLKTIEIEEPDQEIAGKKLKVKSLIVIAEVIK